MPKKRLTLTQSIIGLIPTALIVTIVIFYAKKKETENYLDVTGTYFGYIKQDSEEPLLFKLELNIDSIGNYFSLNDSRNRYYLEDNGSLELVIRGEIDPYTYHMTERKYYLPI